MALDAGRTVWQFPAKGQATDAGQATAGNINGIADKCFFIAVRDYDLVEVGCLIGTVTPADSLVVAVQLAPNTGGTFATIYTLTRGATAIAAGTCLRSIPGTLNFRVRKGNVLSFSVTDDVASGTGCFYAVLYPAGDPATHLFYTAAAPAGYRIAETISST